MYLTYAEYTAMGGTISQAAYNRLEFKARKIIDQHTYGRLMALETQSESVKMAMFELVGLVQKSDVTSADSKQISSESVGDVSTSYAAVTIASFEQLKAESLDVIGSHLSDEKLKMVLPYFIWGWQGENQHRLYNNLL